jgi:ribosomal protein L12E/L44/L45/RPP1/RPP2
MKRVTVDEVMSWEPCEKYTRTRVTELFAGRKTVSAMNVLGMDIPADDKLWAVLHPEMIPEPALHEFACRVAHACLTARRKEGHKIDPRSWRAIRVKRAWLEGKATDEALASARSAAYSAARSAESAAAWSAARSAESAAAWSAAWAAAREQQVEMLREMLEEL